MAWYKGFFATTNDITPGISLVERKYSLTYVEIRWWPTPEYVEYQSALDIPEFGIQRSDAVNAGKNYLVIPRGQRAKVLAATNSKGNTSYCTDLERNGDVVMLHPGGVHPNGAIMAGYITIPLRRPTPESAKLFRLFSRELAKGFASILDNLRHEWWVGPEALEMLKSGGHLVPRHVLDSPHDDLTYPGQPR